MPRDYKVFLEDILEAIGKIRLYTGGLLRCKPSRLTLKLSTP